MRAIAWVFIILGAASAADGATDEYGRDLRSPSAAVREQAARSLGRLGDRQAVPALVEALRDAEKGVRREAAKALGQLKDGRAVEGLLGALGDADTNVRMYAAYALGEIKDARAAAPLIAALGDEEYCVRDQAAWALRELHDPGVAATLVALLRSAEADVPHVVWILRHLEPAETVDQLALLLRDPDAETRLRAAGALGQFDLPETFTPLLAALHDGDPRVRLSAVATLAKRGDERAREPLAALADRDTDPAVQRAAAEAARAMSCEKDLAAHWSFDDGNAATAKDVTGHGNEGAIRGCTPVAGKVGRALAFGEAKYVELDKPAGLPIADQPFTVMAWIRAEAPDGVVVARGGAFCGYSLYIKDGLAKFGIHRVQEGPTSIATSREEVVGRWVHLAGVVCSDRIELYVDGELAARTKTAGYIPGNCGQGMEIGFDVGNSPAEIVDAFHGTIDEVKIYHAELDADDIAHQCRPERPSPPATDRESP